MLRRSHEPDAGALSAYVDGALERSAAARLQEHLAGCAACRSRLEELRGVRATLAALPRPEPRRSFRLRPADVAAPARAPALSRSPLLAAMPAVSAAAIIVFAAVLATDVATRDGDGTGPSAERQAAGDRSAMESDDAFSPGDVQRLDTQTAEKNVEPPAAAPPSGVTAPDAAPTGVAADADPSAARAPAPAQSLAPTSEDGVLLDGGTQPQPTEQPADAAATSPAGQLGEEEAMRRMADEDDDDGARTGFVVAEIAAAAVAVAAAGAFIASRIRRRNQT